MAHLVFIEDRYGDVVDYEVYCSDSCANTSELYNGWNGCNEISVTEPCANCEAVVPGLDNAYQFNENSQHFEMIEEI